MGVNPHVATGAIHCYAFGCKAHVLSSVLLSFSELTPCCERTLTPFVLMPQAPLIACGLYVTITASLILLGPCPSFFVPVAPFHFSCELPGPGKGPSTFPPHIICAACATLAKLSIRAMPPYARRPTIAAGATFSSSLMRPPSPYPAYESRDVEMGSPPSPLSPLTMSSPVEPPPWIAWQEGMAQASAPELEEVSCQVCLIPLSPTPLQWCYSCVGGEDLVICGLCDRAICTTTCLDLPIKFKDIQGPSYAFACPKCHDDYYGKTPGVTVAPYFVRRPCFLRSALEKLSSF
jgi:hypothetical protein